MFKKITPKKHKIKDFLFFSSVLFKNGNALALFIDAKDQLDAENKTKIWINERGAFAELDSTFTTPIVEIIK